MNIHDDTVKLNVVIEQEYEIPIDALTARETPKADLEARAEDFFWSNWSEFLDNEPPTKDDVTVLSAIAPNTIDGERRCTECGTSVEDEPYELWLFSTCRDCAEAEATAGGSDD